MEDHERKEGKIKGDGTRGRLRRGLHMGWRGTGAQRPRAVLSRFRPKMQRASRAVPDRLRLVAGGRR